MEPDTMLYIFPESPTVADEIDESSISVITADPVTETLPVAFVGRELDIVSNGNSKFPASKRSFNRLRLKLTHKYNQYFQNLQL